MKNTLVMIVVFVGLVGWPRPAQGQEVSVHVEDDCGGYGIYGWLDQGGTIVFFQACETPTGGFANVWNDNDVEKMTSVWRNGEESTYFIHGIEVASSNTEQELAEMAGVFATAEAVLAGQFLWTKLNEAGYTESTHPVPMAAIGANITAYEHLYGQACCPVPAGDDCLGCCGWGCPGCTGCYTDECLAHDLCVRAVGHIACFPLLPAAAESARKCIAKRIGY